jgi:two-component system sensor histidine kinase KdpD
VLTIAIARGELAALVTAVLSVLALNFFFITPRHRLSIAHDQDVVELVVVLIAAVVVGRLASTGRQRAAEAESRAELAAAREREAELIADAASAILAGHGLPARMQKVAGLIATATGAGTARMALEAAPSAHEGEQAIRLPSSAQPGWLYVSSDCRFSQAQLERIAGPLGRLIDVAIERDRIADQAAEAEGARRAEVAKTAILHAISHDLRSPLTTMTTAGAALKAPGVTEAEREELLDVIETEAGVLLDWSTTCSTCPGSRRTRCSPEPTGVTFTTRSPPRQCSSVAIRCSSSRCRTTSRWCEPTLRSSSACSPT